MRNHLIAVIDAARARFFEIEPKDERAGVRLVEIDDLINPERLVPDSELFAESRSGQRREHAGGPRHGVDDGRASHAAERERRFAAEILASAATRVRPTGHLLLVAGPEMLGHLRERRDALPAGVHIAEYGKNVTHESAAQLRDRLLQEGLIG